MTSGEAGRSGKRSGVEYRLVRGRLPPKQFLDEATLVPALAMPQLVPDPSLSALGGQRITVAAGTGAESALAAFYAETRSTTASPRLAT